MQDETHVIAQAPLHTYRYGDDSSELLQGHSTGPYNWELIWCLSN